MSLFSTGMQGEFGSTQYSVFVYSPSSSDILITFQMCAQHGGMTSSTSMMSEATARAFADDLIRAADALAAAKKEAA